MTLEEMAMEVCEVNKDNGWFEEDRRFAEDMALLHSEVSEALEAYRSNGLDDMTNIWDSDGTAPQKPEGVGSELADILIRLLDTCHRYDIDLEAEYTRKIAFNRTRGYRHGGKRL
jgi:NTP pyrophosphatase (non-canonical NTP hydrolase)